MKFIKIKKDWFKGADYKIKFGVVDPHPPIPTCALYLDHEPVWDGCGFSCYTCGIVFAPLKEAPQEKRNK